MDPNRWLHLRHSSGFSEPEFERFEAHCRVFEAYVSTLLKNWREIGAGNYDAPRYEFGAPELSADRKIATLPVGGTSTVGSRDVIENMSSQFLWRFFPVAFRRDLDEGITEDIGSGRGFETNWRKVPEFVIPALAAPEQPSS